MLTSVDGSPKVNTCSCPAFSCETTSGKFFQISLAVMGVAGAIFSFLRGQPMTLTVGMALVPTSIIVINVILRYCRAPKQEDPDPHGSYPDKLFYEVAFGKEEDVANRLAESFDPNIKYLGDTALFFSLYFPNPRKIELLLDSGKFDLATKNQHGDTVLEYLLLNLNSDHRYKDIIYLLLRKNPDYKTAVSKADTLVKLFKFLFTNKEDSQNTFLRDLGVKIQANEFGDFSSTKDLMDQVMRTSWTISGLLDHLCIIIKDRTDFPQKALEIISQKIGKNDSQLVYTTFLKYLDVEALPDQQIFNLFLKYQENVDVTFWKFFLAKFFDYKKLKKLMLEFNQTLPQGYDVLTFRSLNDLIYARVKELGGW